MGLDDRRGLRPPIHDATLVAQVIEGRQRLADAVHMRLAAADRRLDATQQAQGRGAVAAAYAAELLAQGRRAVLFAAAVGLVLLAGGLAFRLAQVRAPAPLPDSPAPAVAGEAVRGAPADDIIVTNYVIFAERSRNVGGTDFRVQAGHRFANERAATFESAWCYVYAVADGLIVNLNLGTLAPGGTPVPSPDPFTRTALGLNAAQEAELFAACPWKDFSANGTPGG
jgi:hypothetical protein